MSYAAPLEEMRFVLEMDLRLLELAKPLDKASLVSVDQNVANRRVFQQWLDGSVAPHFIDNLVREDIEFFLIERQTAVAGVIAHISPDLPGELIRRQFIERRQIEFVDNQRVKLQPFFE